MTFTNLHYCFETKNARRCWVGMLVPGATSLEAAEPFVRLLEEYSEAGLRQINVIAFESTQGMKAIIRQESQHYTEPCGVPADISHIGLVKLQHGQTMHQWEIFIPAIARQHIAWHNRNRLKVHRDVSERIATVFAEIAGLKRQEVFGDWSDIIVSRQRGTLIKFGMFEFPC